MTSLLISNEQCMKRQGSCGQTGTRYPAMPACVHTQAWLDINSPAERLRRRVLGDLYVND
jgi:hypothetical protein